jgi:quercetin dioxygenase-like cupin family protein
LRKPFKRNWKTSQQELLFDNQAVRRTGLASNDPTSPNFEVLNHGVLKPGLRLPWFFHEDKDEVILVLKGRSTVHFQEADSIELVEGDVLCIPGGIHHSIENRSEENFEAVFIRVFC